MHPLEKLDLKAKNIAICLMTYEENAKVINFHIKSRGVERPRLCITFEKYTTNFYFENGKVDIKTTNCSSY